MEVPVFFHGHTTIIKPNVPRHSKEEIQSRFSEALKSIALAEKGKAPIKEVVLTSDDDDDDDDDDEIGELSQSILKQVRSIKTEKVFIYKFYIFIFLFFPYFDVARPIDQLPEFQKVFFI